jgi:hypothetical protein
LLNVIHLSLHPAGAALFISRMGCRITANSVVHVIAFDMSHTLMHYKIRMSA